MNSPIERRALLKRFGATAAAGAGLAAAGDAVLPGVAGAATTMGATDGTANQVWVESYGAVGDGKSHRLAERYLTLASAQAVYPFAGSLDDEIDWAAWQKAVYAVSSRGALPGGTSAKQGGTVCSGPGVFVFNKPVLFNNATWFIGSGSAWSGDIWNTTTIRPRADFDGTPGDSARPGKYLFKFVSGWMHMNRIERLALSGKDPDGVAVPDLSGLGSSGMGETSKILDVSTDDFTLDGIYMQGSQAPGNIENLHGNHNGRALLHLAGATGTMTVTAISGDDNNNHVRVTTANGFQLTLIGLKAEINFNDVPTALDPAILLDGFGASQLMLIGGKATGKSPRTDFIKLTNSRNVPLSKPAITLLGFETGYGSPVWTNLINDEAAAKPRKVKSQMLSQRFGFVTYNQPLIETGSGSTSHRFADDQVLIWGAGDNEGYTVKAGPYGNGATWGVDGTTGNEAASFFSNSKTGLTVNAPNGYVALSARKDAPIQVGKLTDTGAVQLQRRLQFAKAADLSKTPGAAPAQVKGYILATDNAGATIKIPYY